MDLRVKLYESNEGNMTTNMNIELKLTKSRVIKNIYFVELYQFKHYEAILLGSFSLDPYLWLVCPEIIDCHFELPISTPSSISGDSTSGRWRPKSIRPPCFTLIHPAICRWSFLGAYQPAPHATSHDTFKTEFAISPIPYSLLGRYQKFVLPVNFGDHQVVQLECWVKS